MQLVTRLPSLRGLGVRKQATVGISPVTAKTGPGWIEGPAPGILRGARADADWEVLQGFRLTNGVAGEERPTSEVIDLTGRRFSRSTNQRG